MTDVGTHRRADHNTDRAVLMYLKTPLWGISLDEWGKLLILQCSLLAIYLPNHIASPLLLVALLLAYRERHVIRVSPRMKQIALLFLVYIGIFVLLSTDLSRSLKGAADMMRGMLVFFVAYVLAAKLSDPRNMLIFTAVSCTAILGSFVFPQQGGDYFGYHINANNSAVTLVIFIILTIPLFTPHSRRWAALGFAFIGISAGVYLLLLTNARGAWLGLTSAIVASLLLAPVARTRHRVYGVLILFLTLFNALYWANYKGFSLNFRDLLWQSLFQTTLQQQPWFGFGINTTKNITPHLNLPDPSIFTAHNLFLEVFVYSGILGLLLFLAILVTLIRHLSSFKYRNSTLFYMGVSGLAAYIGMAQVDMKLASFRFMASISLFLALLYSQRVPDSKRSSAGYTSPDNVTQAHYTNEG